ncbi:MAG: NADH-quinone oxidoreductase subunit L [Dehalococcoidia bacterium]
MSTPLGMEWTFLAPAVCLGAFAVLALFGRYLPGKGSLLSVAAIGFGFVLFWLILPDVLGSETPNLFSRTWFESGDTRLSLGMAIDELSLVMVGIVTAVAFMVQVYSVGYMRGEPRMDWYWAVHSLFAASMLGLVLADNLLLLYITWELVGICSYLLIGFYYERRSAAEAAKKAFVTTRIGDVGFFIAILLLFKETGTFDISTILGSVAAGEISQGMLTLIASLIFLGAMGKSAQFPLHVWLPDAMEGPAPVSALIHAATMVAAGVYLVGRMYPIFLAGSGALVFVVIIGSITALLAGTLALVQNDIKRVLAYSTISQLGFMMISLGAFGFTAALFHLLTHAFFKALLFMGAGSISHATGTNDIREMGGLGRRMPVTTITFMIAAGALAGFPALSGFWSKDEILNVALDHRGAWLYVIVLIAAFLSVLYMTRLVSKVFFGPLREGSRHVHESPSVMIIPMALLAIPAAGAGFLALDYTVAYGGFGTFLFSGESQPFDYSVLTTTLSMIVLLAGMGAYLLWRRSIQRVAAEPQRALGRIYTQIYRLLDNKYYIDEAYQWAIDKGVLVFSAGVALFDRLVVNNTGVDGVGKSAVLTSLTLRLHQTGQVANYVLVILVSTTILILIVAFS